MLVLTRKVNESITILNNITVSILEIKGNQIRLGIKAPNDVPVYRTEIYDSMKEENIRASETPHDLDEVRAVLDSIGHKKRD